MSTSAPSPSLRILVVENHEDSRRYLAMYLSGCDHRVATAASMQEALAMAPEAEYDVLISDIGLPDGDGWELLQQARFIHPVFAVAMSGFGMNSDRDRSKQAGYRHHLLKPLDIDQLDAILAEAAEALRSPSP
jgi:two-component system CheB/CheR fusion protein